jgi:hypothetical protein
MQIAALTSSVALGGGYIAYRSMQFKKPGDTSAKLAAHVSEPTSTESDQQSAQELDLELIGSSKSMVIDFDDTELMSSSKSRPVDLEWEQLEIVMPGSKSPGVFLQLLNEQDQPPGPPATQPAESTESETP